MKTSVVAAGAVVVGVVVVGAVASVVIGANVVPGGGVAVVGDVASVVIGANVVNSRNKAVETGARVVVVEAAATGIVVGAVPSVEERDNVAVGIAVDAPGADVGVGRALGFL